MAQSKNHKEYKPRLAQTDIPEIDNLNKRYWSAVVPVSADIIYYGDEVHIFHNSVSGVSTYIPPKIKRSKQNQRLLKKTIDKMIKNGATTHTYIFSVCKIVHVTNDLTNILRYAGNVEVREKSNITWQWQPRKEVKYGLQKGRYVLYNGQWIRTDKLI